MRISDWSSDVCSSDLWRAAAVQVLRLGLPIAAILTAEASLFQVGALLVARFGAETMAAHQIAINWASLMFMIPLSIGMAATVRVGHAAGACDAAAVALRGRAGILIDRKSTRLNSSH